MAKLSKSQKASLERATLRYMENVELAEEYLASRGIDLEFARSSGLGVVVDPVPEHEGRGGRLSIPYLTDAGPVNMAFRCCKIHDCRERGHERYLFTEGCGTNLYSVQSLAVASDWIAVAEGEIDTLTLNMIGIPAVGVSGATKWKDHWRNIFDDFNRVYVFTDGDPEDGGGDKMWAKWGAEIPRATRVRMAPGEDVNSTFLKRGADYLRGKIRT